MDLGQGKFWWQSKGMWGGIIAIVATGAALFGYQIDEAETLNIVMQVAALAGGILAVVGRVKAKQPIKKKRDLKRVDNMNETTTKPG